MCAHIVNNHSIRNSPTCTATNHTALDTKLNLGSIRSSRAVDVTLRSAVKRTSLQTVTHSVVEYRDTADGVAGGLDPALSVGAVYRASKAVEYDFDLSKVNGTSVGTPNERDTPFFELAAAGDWPFAVVATGDRFTDDENDFDFLRNTFGASVRDMELGAIAHVAFHAGIPVCSFKAITNVVGQGAMTAQYKENLPRCLDVLAREVPSFFAAV
jgi:hypothetical protein